MDLFEREKMVLIVSLPRNETALAEAAVAGGAHALKVHLNVTHAASGTRFGSFSEEQPRIAAILETARNGNALVGIMPGAEITATRAELHLLADMGVRFMDIYDFHVPDPEYLNVAGLEPMIAIGPGFKMNDVTDKREAGLRLMEASMIQHEQYGTLLTEDDTDLYRAVCAAFGGHVVVPTQKNIRPEQLHELRAAGVRGIMIGAIVTGAQPSSLCEATTAFRNAIDSMENTL
jgi:hypothetical protein